MLKILSKYGAKKIRQRGSHLFIEFNGKSTVIPLHSNKDLGKGLLKKIFDDLDLEDTDVYEKLILD
ncbi:MAG: type II toxin-antitoxin system HicA family toxin [Candidatus Gracilibacteria bacterium]|nr:type II toxin-antitoxin system HicA family toxin [Candidatus Gracilibacteria bacterium]MDQ7022686.1 type II toxin-antitoxin system HicA family toxin [Candidatus Gracilibacteria bacterium]